MHRPASEINRPSGISNALSTHQCLNAIGHCGGGEPHETLAVCGDESKA